GAACVGAPLLDSTGEAIAAVSVAGPLARMGKETRAEIGALMIAALAEARRAMDQAPRGGGR
ncbi:MAG: IclR family transcriptional regulator domain-containing protein, partial [Elsteraceae bacterium]